MLNRAEIIGRLGKDPEFRNTQGGARVANFSVATTESWVDKRTGERQENTQWHNVVIWQEGLVGVVEKYVRKGDLIYISGKIETRKWKDQSGADRYTTEIVLRQFGGELKLLTTKSEREQLDRAEQQSSRGESYSEPYKAPASSRYSDAMDDEIPF